MATFKEGSGDWREYRGLKPNIEVDFHFDPRERWGPRYPGDYDNDMAENAVKVMESLKDAQTQGIPWVIFTHGHSTSRPGKKTARSVVRQVMRSAEATPFIVRKDCIQHNSVFVAAIRSLGKE